MAEDSQGKPAEEINLSKVERQFESAVGRARWTGYAERLWNKGAPTIGGLSAVFLTASWSGMVWPYLSPSMRVTGVMLFGAALAASVAALTKVKMPNRLEALDRMDKANLGERLATTFDDIPADDESLSPESRAVWNFERKRIAKKVGGKFNAGGFKSDIIKHDPYAARFAALLITGIAFWGAYGADSVGERIADAFEWQIASPHTGPSRIDAWVNVPDYTGEAPIFIASKERPGEVAGSEFDVPANSVLTLLVHERNVAIEADGGITPVAEACQEAESGSQTRCEFTFSSDTALTIKRGDDEPLTWRFDVEANNPPSITIRAVEQLEEQQGDEPEIRLEYTIEDEHGTGTPEVEIRPQRQQDPEAERLPFMNLPINIPIR